MRVDQYGQIILDEMDFCRLYLQHPDRTIRGALVDRLIPIHADLEIKNLPEQIQYATSTETIDDFDRRLQSKWLMPQEYQDFDIAEWILNQCQTDAERQRVGHELMLYLEKDLFPLLQYLKYMVDTMRQHNIIWGIGRGSSVASYVLFLIGVHKIDSLYYDLDITEFLR
jgi:DNA polymerase III alpha subunit